MKNPTAVPDTLTESAAQAPGHRRLPNAASLALLASIIVSFLAASSAPTPLYAHYQAQWGFTPLTTTVVFGAYAIAVLAALLVFGRISDHLGRRPVLWAALAGQAVAMLVFADAGNVTALLAARIVQGLSTGSAMAAVGAALVDVDRSRGTLANAVAPLAGTATGSLASALIVQYLPAPGRLVYLLLLAVFALQAVGVLLLPETVRPTPGALASLVPRPVLPRHLLRPVAITAPVLLAVWALAGFHGSLGPALTTRLAHSDSAVYRGLSLFTLAAAAAVSVLLLRGLPALAVLRTAVLAVITGTAVTIASITAGWTAGFLVGTAVAGIGFGGGLHGGIRMVVPLAASGERAGVLSLLHTVSYLGMGIPAVLGGAAVVRSGDLPTTAARYGTAVIALAALALAGLLAYRRTLAHHTGTATASPPATGTEHSCIG
ncbi:MFS transporter [Streptomyces sp. NPDC049910]|uniref:MFS transporter n=1 Tax=Streptomyces sp. NPDC049910 TaxID=3155278 RepID=UPI0034252FEE